MREIWPWRFIDGHASYGVGLSITPSQTKIAFLLHAPRTGTIDSIEFKLGTVTTPADLLVSLQDIDLSTGSPDGVVDQFGVVPSASVVSQAWLTVGLTLDGTPTSSKRSVVRGDWFAVVIGFSGATGTIAFKMSLTGVAWDFLENIQFFGSIWTRPTPTLPCYVLHYTDGVYATTRAAACAPSNITAVSPTVNTTPDEYAIRVQLPFTGLCAGAIVNLGFNSGAYNVVLYAPNGGTLMSVSGLKGSIVSVGVVFTQFTSIVALLPGVPYRLAVVPTTTTAVKLTVYDVQNCGIHEAHPGGQDWYLSTRTNAGAWTDTTLQRPLIAPFLVDLE